MITGGAGCPSATPEAVNRRTIVSTRSFRGGTRSDDMSVFPFELSAAKGVSELRPVIYVRTQAEKGLKALRASACLRRACRHEHVARHDSGVAQREERRRNRRTKRRAEAVAVAEIRGQVAGETRDRNDRRGQAHFVVVS